MQNNLNSEKLAEITKGTALSNFDVTSFSIDSSEVQSGDTFIALIGNKVNGHSYIFNAIEKGATSIMMQQDYYNEHKEQFADFKHILIVKDTYQAMLDIAKYKRDHFDGKVVGVTGSVGKTSLKEMLALVLSSAKISYSKLSYNSQITMPLSILNFDLSAEIWVLEMGMSKPSELSFLSKLARPHIAVITEIALVHYLNFENETQDAGNAIALAKLEIVDGMDQNGIGDGILILNKDSSYYSFLAIEALKRKPRLHIIDNTMACVTKKDFVFENMQNFYYDVELSIAGSKVNYHLKSLAEHNIMLVNFALLVANCLNLNLTQCAENVQKFALVRGRGSVNKVTLNNKILYVIDESYNANPASMASSLNYLSEIPSPKIIILGDMLELGSIESAEHLKLLTIIQNIKPKIFITVGSLMAPLAEEYKKANDSIVASFGTYQEADAYFRQLELQDNDVLFVKGSKGSLVRKIVKSLIE